MEAFGQLTGGIAHDFNNLLTVVVGGLDIIAKRAETRSSSAMRRTRLSAAERGARLTGQLLAFSRVQRLEVRPTLVAPLIQNMRPLLRNVLGPGIEKRFDLDEAMMPVMADPTQLEVAILNLAINARDAMPDGGILTFASRRCKVAATPSSRTAIMSSSPSPTPGRACRAEVADRAFEPFFTTKEVGKGTGLGLSMVYGMARQSGGVARIESRARRGDRGQAALPQGRRRSGRRSRARPTEQADASRNAGASVLVIDDDPDVRGFIAATLEEQGYRVRQASDGRQGLAEFAREKARPRGARLHHARPVGRRGRQPDPRRSARQPILFVSGYSETEAVKRTAPDAPLLAKPFRAEALDKAVRTVLAAAG